MTKLSIYADGAGRQATYVMEGETRNLYYAAMQIMRYCRRGGEDVPYMRSSNGKLNLLLACKYMAYNFGFDE